MSRENGRVSVFPDDRWWLLLFVMAVVVVVVVVISHALGAHVNME